MNRFSGYYRQPTVFFDKIVFVAEDDLWIVDVGGGTARRLTANLGAVSSPCFSEDGKLIAFTGSEEGHSEVYVIPSEGGQAKRLTYRGKVMKIACWLSNKVVFVSSMNNPFSREATLHSVSLEGELPQEFKLGPATGYSKQGKTAVLSRNNWDSAMWKRYRGGTAGELWIDKEGDGGFVKLFDRSADKSFPNSNFGSPMLVEDKLVFVSDHEGIANLYSSDYSGKNLKKLTDHRDFYVRNARTDGRKIVYHAGADIYIYDLAKKKEQKVNIDFYSPLIQRSRKFVSAEKYLETAQIDSKGKKIVVSVRGKAFSFSNWDGPVLQHGERDGIRYRLPVWLNDNKRFAVLSDQDGEERILIISSETNTIEKRLKNLDIGRVNEMLANPKEDELALTNHRNEIFTIDLGTEKLEMVDKSNHDLILGFDWSPDGKWLTYGFAKDRVKNLIKLYSKEKKKIYEATEPILGDMNPNFDPTGKYIYFISQRILNPVYDSAHFDLSFPKTMLPYALVLDKESKSPFDLTDEDWEKKQDESEAEKKKVKKDKVSEIKVKIETGDIHKRVVPLPLSEGIYYKVFASEERIFFLKDEPRGALSESMFSGGNPTASLEFYDLKKKKHEVLIRGVTDADISADRKSILVSEKGKMRIIGSGADSKSLSSKKSFSRETGWVDSDRIKVSINPIFEWRQMFNEAWRLQRDFFWTEDMSDIDWKKVYTRYYPLVDRVTTKTEFSDLVYEMQGELGTSHAYVFGGDYRPSPAYSIGVLGAEFEYVKKYGCYKFKKVFDRDYWEQKNSPPLMKPGANVKEGMLLKAVNGYNLSRENSPCKLLINLVNQEVKLTIADSNNKGERDIVVKTTSSDGRMLYRDWVEKNREYVHKKSKGKVGYVHIPDMSAEGYSEFHRYYLQEYDYEGLIIDVRFNGGGHVSQLILEKLARKRLGYDQTRWWGTSPYPDFSPKGPLVALTNEYAGSDGDIFSHCFKLMKLGKLIGKRTWGGVIGIWPRNWLVDGTITTQPEFSFWFKDVGWQVENYGTDPDIFVEMSPCDYANEKDPQLDRAIKEILSEIKKNPPFEPKLNNRPRLTLPT